MCLLYESALASRAIDSYRQLERVADLDSPAGREIRLYYWPRPDTSEASEVNSVEPKEMYHQKKSFDIGLHLCKEHSGLGKQ